ncbi:hypothetical protein E5198_00970 [Pseudomonas sp. A-1]|uniref:hypothetical protein n=1 Tax=Pseudomonas sp. A-1 TaxID=1821274 RepID=UPI0010A69082|nr:hypothetical protein [Pseudomonas sp. A-1]THG87117.1 hypothetical protein E5198_00970 [Pseudomonas sp. A-1]
MLRVYSSAILMVLGMVAVVPQPLAGMAMLGIGIWLFLSTTPGQRHEASSLFFGLALLGMAITTLIAIADVFL